MLPEILALLTWVVTVLVWPASVTIGPFGSGLYANETTAKFGIGLICGIAVAVTLKVIATVSPGAISGVVTPFAGFWVESETPFIVTEPGTKVVPFGIASVIKTFVVGILPEFLAVTV